MPTAARYYAPIIIHPQAPPPFTANAAVPARHQLPAHIQTSHYGRFTTIQANNMNHKDFIKTLYEKHQHTLRGFPDKGSAQQWADDLFDFLFAAPKGTYDSEAQLRRQYEALENTFSTIAHGILHDEALVSEATETFFNSIPAVYDALLRDAAAVFLFDPAATSIEEVLLAYPGFYASAIYRLAHQLYKLELKTLARVLSEHAHTKTGIDIHPGASIGHSFCIDHGTGIVIGETTIIGDNVKIYQGVTLGALNVGKQYAATRRHPVIENDVIIYSGATILGGTTRVGHNSVIGGNVWLTESVAPYSVVYHKSEVVVRDKSPLPEAINFVI